MSNGFYSRKVDFPTIPWMDAEDAENWPKNELGQLVYRAKNSNLTRGVIYNEYYWVDSNKNHIPFFNNEIQVGIGAPINDPESLGPFIYLDSSTGIIHTWENTTNTWVTVSGESLNIYNSDGTLSANRTINGDGLNINFDNLNRFTLSGIIELSTLPITSNSNVSILTRNDTTGEIEIREVSSIIGGSSIALDFQSNGSSIGDISTFSILNVSGPTIDFRDGGDGLATIRVAPQDLNGTPTSTTYDLGISYGIGASIPLANNTNAGLMSPSQFNKLGFISITQSVDLDLIEAQSINLISLTGMPSLAFTLGSFTGSTITDNTTIKNALQLLETSVEGKHSLIQFRDEGINLGVSGAATIINFTGLGVTSSLSGNILTIDIPGSTGGGQVGIQWQDEGINLGTSGTATIFNSIGDLLKLTRSTNTITSTSPNIGENLLLPSLDPSNLLSVKLGELNTNWVEVTSSGRIVDVNIPGFNDTWNPSNATGKASVILFKAASPAIWTSLLGGSEGKWVKLINLSNTLLVLENNSTFGTSSARFVSGTGRPVLIMANQSVDLIYTSGKWLMCNLPTYDIWEDFTGLYLGMPAGSYFLSSIQMTLATGGGTTVGGTQTKLGTVNMTTATGRTYVGETPSHKQLINNVGSCYFDRISLSAAPASNIRLARGFVSANSGSWEGTLGSITGGSMIYFPDSGRTNATTNWFFYVGDGTVGNFFANAIDSGIPISESINNFTNCIVYTSLVSLDTTFIYSANGRDYFISGNINTGTVLNGGYLAANIFWRITGTTPTYGMDYYMSHNPIKITR